MTTFSGGFGNRPGEQVTGQLDTSSQVVLPLQQGLARICIDIIALTSIIGAYMLLGYFVSFLVVGFALWLKKEALLDFLHNHARNRNAIRLIMLLDRAGLWLYALTAWLPLYVVTRWRWYYSIIDRKHFLLWVGRTGGFTPVYFPLLLRLFLLIVIIAMWLSWDVLRNHFKNELLAFFPMAAINPAKDGLDARTWNKARQTQDDLKVNVRLTTRQVPALDYRPRDTGQVYPGDTISHNEMEATYRQWQLVSRESMRMTPNISESNMTRVVNGDRVFEARPWRAFRDNCVTASLMESAGAGANGTRAGYRFTDAGLQFFQAREWSPTRLTLQPDEWVE